MATVRRSSWATTRVPVVNFTLFAVAPPVFCTVTATAMSPQLVRTSEVVVTTSFAGSGVGVGVGVGDGLATDWVMATVTAMDLASVLVSALVMDHQAATQSPDICAVATVCHCASSNVRAKTCR